MWWRLLRFSLICDLRWVIATNNGVLGGGRYSDPGDLQQLEITGHGAVVKKRRRRLSVKVRRAELYRDEWMAGQVKLHNHTIRGWMDGYCNVLQIVIRVKHGHGMGNWMCCKQKLSSVADKGDQVAWDGMGMAPSCNMFIGIEWEAMNIVETMNPTRIRRRTMSITDNNGNCSMDIFSGCSSSSPGYLPGIQIEVVGRKLMTREIIDSSQFAKGKEWEELLWIVPTAI